MKFIRNIWILALPVMLLGCVSSTMVVAPQQQVTPPAPGRAKIIFMRVSTVAGAIASDIIETTGGDLKYVGSMYFGNKIIYETSPGEKVFMAYGTAADFMKANVVAGKTYYVIVRPNWGTGGFAPTPIRLDHSSEFNVNTPEFKQWYAETEVLEPGPEAASWFAANKASLLEVYNTYWPRFQTKTPEEIDERTLYPGDGR